MQRRNFGLKSEGVRVWDVWSLDSRILKNSGLKDSGLKYARKGVFLSVSFVTSY